MLTLGDYLQKHGIILIKIKDQNIAFLSALAWGPWELNVRQILESREFL